MAKHGGARAGAGRPKGSGCYHGEPTRVVRVPASLVDSTVAQLKDYASCLRTPTRRAVGRSRPAGPRAIKLVARQGDSLATQKAEQPCDLNILLVDDNEATFLYTVQSDTMDRVGILVGDQVLVTRGKPAKDGDIVVAMVGGQEVEIRRLRKSTRATTLEPESHDDKHRAVVLSHSDGKVIWGVVTGLIRKLHRA